MSPGKYRTSLLFIVVRRVSTRTGGEDISERPSRFVKREISREQWRFADFRGVRRVLK